MPMYQKYWGLQTSPFRGCVDPALFHQSPTHEEALARLDFLVAEHRRLGLLLGPSGGGKSMLLEVFAAHCRRRGWALALVSMLDLEATELLGLLASQWGLVVEPTLSAAALWRAIGDRLFVYRCQQWEAVVLLDDAHRADPQVMQHVTRLARFDPSPDMWLTIVLAGRNESMARLGESLLGLAALRIELEPWERSETEEFVTALLVQAGQCGPVFDRPAVDRLHELAHGIPRRVCQLADLALLAGAGRNLDQIDAGVVETVYQELGAV